MLPQSRCDCAAQARGHNRSGNGGTGHHPAAKYGIIFPTGRSTMRPHPRPILDGEVFNSRPVLYAMFAATGLVVACSSLAEHRQSSCARGGNDDPQRDRGSPLRLAAAGGAPLRGTGDRKRRPYPLREGRSPGACRKQHRVADSRAQDIPAPIPFILTVWWCVPPWA